jgi:diguanylate cyclase (GGDEF)-like protein
LTNAAESDPELAEAAAFAAAQINSSAVHARWVEVCREDSTLGVIDSLICEIQLVVAFVGALGLDQPMLDFDDEESFVNAVINLSMAPSSAGVAIRQLALLGNELSVDCKHNDRNLERELLRRCRSVTARATIYVVRRSLGELDSFTHLDELTGLPNRRAWNRDLSRALDTNRGESGTAVLIDLDGLKKVNDTRGHLGGDEYLLQFGIYLLEAVGRLGAAYRWAGDEYSVLLRLSAEEAIAVMAQLEGASPAPMSWGAASYPDESVDLHDLEQLADSRLYAMKAQHREGIS